MTNYGIILACVSLFDFILTFIGLLCGLVQELNPFLSFFLNRWGLRGFIAVKLFLVAVPIVSLEIISRCNKIGQRRMANYYKFAIGAYLLIFLAGIFISI